MRNLRRERSRRGYVLLTKITSSSEASSSGAGGSSGASSAGASSSGGSSTGWASSFTKEIILF